MPVDERIFSLRLAEIRARALRGGDFGEGHCPRAGAMVKFHIAQKEEAALKKICDKEASERNHCDLIDAVRACLLCFDIDGSLEMPVGNFRNLENGLNANAVRQLEEFWNRVSLGGMEVTAQNRLRQRMATTFRRELIDALQAESVEIKMLGASDSRKFSLHARGGIIIESNVIEGSAAVCEISRRLLTNLQALLEEVESEERIPEEALARIALCPRKLPRDLRSFSVGGAIDCSVRSRNRLLRMHGNCKMGSDRALRERKNEDGAVVELPDDPLELPRAAKKRLIQRAAGLESDGKKLDLMKALWRSAGAKRANGKRPALQERGNASFTAKDQFSSDAQAHNMGYFFEAEETLDLTAGKRGDTALAERLVEEVDPEAKSAKAIFSDALICIEHAAEPIPADLVGSDGICAV